MHRLKTKIMLFSSTGRSSAPYIPLVHLKPKYFCSSPSFSSSFSFQYSPWSGLQAWRRSPLNESRNWGPNGPESQLLSPLSTIEANDNPVSQASSLAELGSLVLSTSDPLTKSQLSHLAYSRWRRENLPVGQFEPPPRPARPAKPELVGFLLCGSEVVCSSII